MHLLKTFAVVLAISQLFTGVLGVSARAVSTQVGAGDSSATSVGTPGNPDVTSISGTNATTVQGVTITTPEPIVLPTLAPVVEPAAPMIEALAPGMELVNFQYPNATLTAQEYDGFYLQNAALPGAGCVQACAYNGTCGSKQNVSQFFGPDAVLAACEPLVTFWTYENISLFNADGECLALKLTDDIYQTSYFAGNIYTEMGEKCDFTSYVNWILTDDGQLQSEYDISMCATVCTDLTAECSTLGGYSGVNSFNLYAAKCEVGNPNQIFTIAPLAG